MTAALAAFAIAAQAFVAVAIVLGVVQLVSGARPFDALVRMLGSDAVRLAWLVALIATAGSLWYSEVKHFIPCLMCWYQRICMYPLVLVLGAAALSGERRAAWRYAGPLALVGLAASLFHIKLENLGGPSFCSRTGPSCEVAYFHQFGYITIAVMAASAFALILTLLTIGVRHGKSIAREA